MNKEMVNKLLNSLNEEDNKVAIELIIHEVGVYRFDGYVANNFEIDRPTIYNIETDEYSVYMGYKMVDITNKI